MWIFTSGGFVSIVEHRANPDLLMVRGRFKGDAARFLGLAPRLEHETPDADYRFRVVAKRETVERAMVRAVRGVHYPNFKDSIKDAWRKPLAMRIWSVLFGAQEQRHPKPSKRTQRPSADELDGMATAQREEWLDGLTR